MSGLGPVVWQCEIDPFCRAVLAKHWPHVTRYEDVQAKREYPRVELLCGGFPCQDVSSAGKQRGLGGQRSGLWYHFARIVREVRPSWVVVENVASGASKWLRPVRHQLHLFGYRTRALGIAAADVGAPHLRRRVFVVAYAHGISSRRATNTTRVATAPDAYSYELREQRGGCRGSPRRSETESRIDGHAWPPSNTESVGIYGTHATANPCSSWNGGRDGSAPVPAVRRVDDGLSRRVDANRKRALGNSVVPQCAQVVGQVIRQILEDPPDA
jgi:DNA (cytosine-5)-methyltransferase 1